MKGDEWTAADMLRHIRFERGELRFYTDYVRGRMMKTEVIVRANGTVTLTTTNRGEAAKRWVEKLQRKPDFADEASSAGWCAWSARRDRCRSWRRARRADNVETPTTRSCVARVESFDGAPSEREAAR